MLPLYLKHKNIVMKIIIKQKPNDLAKWNGLAEIGLSVYPSAKQSVYLGKEIDGMTWITGLNENASAVLRIEDVKLRKAKQDEIIAKRRKLETLTGLDLGPHSSFWAMHEIVLCEPLKHQLVLQTENPIDEINLCVLLANHFVAPSYEESFGDKYINCIFYVEDEERENSRKYRKQELVDECASVIFQLRNNRDKMFYILKALGISCNEGMTTNGLYILLSGYKNNLKTVEDYEKFLNVFTIDNTTLIAKTVVIEAMKKKIITQSEGFLHWGGTSWGTTTDEVVEAFAKNEDSLMVLKDQVK
jgi:hypothetical protein